MRYTVLIDGKPGAYGAVFPDLPGCTAMGATVDEALTQAADVAREWMRVTEAHGDKVPVARELATVLADPEVKETIRETDAVVASVVVLREAGRPVKANLSLDAGVLAAIDAAAERLKETRSATVELLAKVALPLIG